MFELLVEDRFEAAHCLRGYQGNCERLHGHSYRVQVCIRAPELGDLGMALDFRILRAELRAALADLDHALINDLPDFAETNPTAENLAQFIYARLKQKLGASLHKVTMWETDSAAAAYWEDN
jgi:6-pyruvoyltetrahydropterin/6-carboxytetrahydropterin synthase